MYLLYMRFVVGITWFQLLLPWRMVLCGTYILNGIAAPVWDWLKVVTIWLDREYIIRRSSNFFTFSFPLQFLFKLKKVRCFEEMDTKCLVNVIMVDNRPGRLLVFNLIGSFFCLIFIFMLSMKTSGDPLGNVPNGSSLYLVISQSVLHYLLVKCDEEVSVLSRRCLKSRQHFLGASQKVFKEVFRAVDSNSMCPAFFTFFEASCLY